MKISYDPDVDVLRIILRDVPVEDSDEEKAGVIFDYDSAGSVVGLEILDASRLADDPRKCEYAVAGAA